MVSEFSSIVKKYREEQRLPLRDFAKTISVSHQTVLNWENGTNVPEYYRFLPIAMKFNDWRGDFAFDCMAALCPEHYPPVGPIGEKILGRKE